LRTKWILIGVLLVGTLSALSGAAEQGGSLTVEQTVDPQQIVLRGTGSPDRATVTLKLLGPEIIERPMDLMLVLDRSASVELERVKDIARSFVEHLSAQDRVGIVSFSDVAQLELALTSDLGKALEVIDGLSGGAQTALGDGLKLGIEELAKSDRSGAFELIVLPTDGVNNVGEDPLDSVQRAAAVGVPVFPIALSPAARRTLLSEIARLTGGTFYARFSEDVLESVFRRAERRVVARYIRIVQTLPSHIEYEGALENPPIVNSGREVTQLEWHIPLLFQGDLWQTRFMISASREGSFNINQEPSLVEYTEPSGRHVTIDLVAAAAAILQVGRGPGQPEEEEPQEQPPPEEERDQEPLNEPPAAALTFSPEAPLMGEAVHFDAAKSKDPDGQIAQYEWDWTNDGEFDETTEEPLALHPYGSAGEFTVRLRVTDDQGATAETTVTVKIKEGLKAQAAYTTDFKGDPTVPEWMDYYIDDGVVTDEEVRDANARFAADVYIPGTQYRLTSDDVQAIIQINQLAKLVEAYRDISIAKSDGYVQIGDFIPEVGQLYVKEEFLSGPVAFDRPPVLLYGFDREGKLRLAGVRFIATEEEAKLFQVTDWPKHPASAHFEDGSEQAASTVDKAPLKNSKGSPLVFWHPTLYSLTVWVATINPKGLFASLNPEIVKP